MKILLKICLSTAMFLAITTLATAATTYTYKWVGKDGSIHYSQQPPSNSNYQQLNVQTRSPNSSSSSSNKPAPTYSTPGDSNKSKAASVIKKQQTLSQEQQKNNCDIAKQNLQTYMTYHRIRTKDGKVIRLDDNDRAKRIADTKQQIQEFCQ